MLLIAIAIMLALGLFGMYQWRPVVKFVRDMWIPMILPEMKEAMAKQAKERGYLAVHEKQGGIYEKHGGTSGFESE